MSKHPSIYKDSNVELFLETHPQYKVIIHCYVHNWNKALFKNFVDIWLDLMELLKARGYDDIHAMIGTDNKRLKKFSSMFGFSSTGVFLEDREVYKCST